MPDRPSPQTTAAQTSTSRRRTEAARRRGAVATLVGATVFALGPAVSATAAPSFHTALVGVGRPAVAARGADWTAAQILANGGYLVAYGQPSASDTAYAVVGLVAVGGHQGAVDSAIHWLKTQLSGIKGPDGTDSPGALANLILAGVAGRADVSHFGGVKAANDLPARLLATVRTAGPDTGLVGTSDPTYDGAYRQGLALAALSTTAPTPAKSPRVRLALAWLKDQQCSNGLWTSYRADTSVPCAAADGDTGAGPDTNSSSLAVQGLSAYGQTPRRANVLASMHAAQAADGGFGYGAASGQSSDPDSTALTIQAILAEHLRPGAAAWRKGGATPYDALAAFQLGRTDPAKDRGAFFYPGSRAVNVLATVQAVPAAAARALPVTPG